MLIISRIKYTTVEPAEVDNGNRPAPELCLTTQFRTVTPSKSKIWCSLQCKLDLQGHRIMELAICSQAGN